MKIYQRSGNEKHRFVFIAHVLEGLSPKSGLLWNHTRHKWEDHKLILRYRRSKCISASNIFIPTLSNCNLIKKTPCPPPPAYHTVSWIKISQFILQTKFTQKEFEYNVDHNICHCCLCYILNQIRCQIQGQSIFVLLSKLVLG